MLSQDKKRISCKRCQIRKLKCSRTDPCTSCVSAKQKCEFREIDSKRRPASHEYVAILENRVAWLESFITKLKQASSEERDRMLAEVSFGDHLKPPSNAEDSSPPCLPPTQRRSNLQVGAEGSLIYHGPTSIYQAGQYYEPERTELQSKRTLQAAQVAQHFRLDDSLLTQALRDFFKWQYPHFMFIYREAFLRDHYNNHYGGRYWSPALLYAICALGTLMAADKTETDLSERFFAAAESILMVSGLDQPCITSVQAFLCLAFYELGRGNLSKGWAFSGIAFRMGHDIGFQRDPNHWLSTDRSIATPEDLEIRRRIYWGGYLSDKLISLMLGRSTYLHEDDAAVEPTNMMPHFPEMEHWLPAGFQQGDQADTSLNMPWLLFCFKWHISLSNIVQGMLTKLFSAKGDVGIEGKNNWVDQAYLNFLNLELGRWQESLPASLKWNRWEASTKLLYPHVAALHALFNTVRLCLNLDFALVEEKASQSSKIACFSSVENTIALVRKYKAQHGLDKAPLVFVYSIMQATTAISMFGNPTRNPDNATEETSRPSKIQTDFLLQALDECSATWGLALQVKKMLVRVVNGHGDSAAYGMSASDGSA